MSTSPSTPEIKSEFYPPYAEFSKTLRTWFVGFGIGGPVVLLANEAAWKSIVASQCSGHMGILFLLGGGLQVTSALLNKHAMWHQYIVEPAPYDSPDDKAQKARLKLRWPYKLAEWYSYQNWIDELLDVFTLIVFAWATALAFWVLSPPVGKVVTCDHDCSWYAWVIGIIVALSIFAIRLWRALHQPPRAVVP
jgi:hypothetical protein